MGDDEPFQRPARGLSGQDDPQGQELRADRGDGHAAPAQAGLVGDLEGVERGDEMGEEQGDHGPGVGGRKSPGQDVERPDPDGPCGEEQLEDDPGGEQGVGVFFVLARAPG